MSYIPRSKEKTVHKGQSCLFKCGDSGASETDVKTPLHISFERTRTRKRCCCLRTIEFLVCLTCLGLSVWLIVYNIEIISILMILIIAVPITFFIVTFVDILVTCWYQNIRWHAWLLFAALAVFLFSICVGLMFLSGIFLSYFLYIPFAIAAIIFLIDIIYLVCKVRKLQKVADNDTQTYKESQSSMFELLATPIQETTKEPSRNLYEESQIFSANRIMNDDVRNTDKLCPYLTTPCQQVICDCEIKRIIKPSELRVIPSYNDDDDYDSDDNGDYCERNTVTSTLSSTSTKNVTVIDLCEFCGKKRVYNSRPCK